MQDVLWVVSHIQLADVVDILLVAILFYLLLFLAQGTQAVQLLRGMVLVILVAFLASQMLPFRGFSWLIQTALPALLIAIPIGGQGAFSGNTRLSAPLRHRQHMLPDRAAFADRQHLRSGQVPANLDRRYPMSRQPLQALLK